MDDLFHQLAAILAVSAACGALALKLRQPVIIAFIAVGVIVGPAWLSLIDEEAAIWEVLAEAGIAVLLFVVGLKLDVDVMRRTGPVALATGLGQVVFTSAIGFLICLALGLSVVHAAYVAVALTFSSTIIIVKLLSDKKEIDSLHGRISVGFLIVQDVVVILVLIGLSAFGAGEQDNALGDGGVVLAKGIAFVGGVALLMRFVIPGVFRLLARSPDLLILGAIAWATVSAATASALGFSNEVGAFLAGFALAATPFREAIASRLVSLRDFLLVFFFIVLGAELNFADISSQIPSAIILSAFVLIGNPLIVLIIMGRLGYRARTGFLAGLTVAQISEFSFVLGALGLQLGHITGETLGLITLVGLVTIGLSTYLILYSHLLYQRLARWLRVFERPIPHQADTEEGIPAEEVDLIIYGLGRYGSGLGRELNARGLRPLGIDFDPQAIRDWQLTGNPAHYGDADDMEFYSHLPLASVRWVVSTLPDIDLNLRLLQAVRERGFAGKVALTAHSEQDAALLRRGGADLVLLPFADAAYQAAQELAGEEQGPQVSSS